MIIAWTALALALATPGDYHIGPGDTIDVQVHGEPLGHDGKFVVSASGAVSLTCAGLVEISGQSAHEIADTLRNALMPGCYIDPQITVRVTEHRSQPVEVLGAVQNPGVYYLDRHTTLRAVVTRAGGVKADRSTGQIVVSRKGHEPLQIPLGALDDVLGDYPLESGDIVTIDEGRIVFVTGEVTKPGEFAFAEGITVSEAFIRAGGRTAVARLSGSYLLRDGEKIQVNLRRIFKGKDADMRLEPGDQLVVPESVL